MAQQFLDEKEHLELYSAVNQLLDLQLNSSSVDEPTRKLLKERFERLKVNHIKPIDELKARMTKRCADYKEPRLDIPACIENYNETVEQQNEDDKNQDLFAAASALAHGFPSHARAPNQAFIQTSPAYCQLGDEFYAIIDGKVDRENPLKNPFTFSYESHMKHLVVKSPMNGHLHVLRSLENFIDFGESKGISKKDLSDLLKQFVQIELPHASGVFQYLRDADQVFKSLIDLISYTNLAKECTKQIGQISRVFNEKGVAQNISTPLTLYRSLMAERLFLECPHLDTDKQYQKIDKEAKKFIKHLVEDNLRIECNKFEQKFYGKHSRKCTLADLVEFIDDRELLDTYSLKSNKYINGKDVSVSVYNVEYYHVPEDEQPMNCDDVVEVNLTRYGPYTQRNQVGSRYDLRAPNQMRPPARYPNQENRGYVGPVYPTQVNSGFSAAPPSPYLQSPHSVPDRSYGGGSGNPLSTQSDNRSPQVTSSAQSQQSPGNRPSTPSGVSTSSGYTSSTSVRSPARYDPSAPSPTPSDAHRLASRKSSPSPTYYRTSSNNFRALSKDRVYTKSPGGTLRPKERGRNRNKERCNRCGSRTHSKPAPKGVVEKDASLVCPYKLYPKTKDLCSFCKSGFHPRAVCIKAFANENNSGQNNGGRAPSNDRSNSNPTRPSFSSLNPAISKKN